MVLIHSLLLLPVKLVLPCIDDLCSLLPGLDTLSKISTAAEVLDKQEMEWPKDGKQYLVASTLT